MAQVLFFEKPGCIGNAEQKRLLAAAGHDLEVRSLLAEPWTTEELRAYFGNLPVTEWFNRTAPQVKSGAVVPERLDESEALRLMLETPLLVRRPLMRVGEERRVGFDPTAVDAWIGLTPAALGRDLERCPSDGAEPCPEPMT